MTSEAQQKEKVSLASLEEAKNTKSHKCSTFIPVNAAPTGAVKTKMLPLPIRLNGKINITIPPPSLKIPTQKRQYDPSKSFETSLSNHSNASIMERIQYTQSRERELVTADECCSLSRNNDTPSEIHRDSQVSASKRKEKVPDTPVNERKITKVNDKYLSEIKSNKRQNERHNDLVSSVKKFGDARVSENFTQNPSLENLVAKQKRCDKQNQSENSSFGITEDRIRMLNKIGVERNALGDQWDRRFEELVSYEKEYGNFCVPAKFAQNPSLGYWVYRQRRTYRKYQNGNLLCRITEDRIRLLNKIGFKWNTSCDQWDRRYEELVSYVKEFGDTRVPERFTQNPSLGIWVSTQKRNYRKYQDGHSLCNITKNRILLLNKIGFEWNLLSDHQWDMRYEELVSYLKEFGDTRVPQKFTKNPPLGQWVSKQKNNYRKYQEGHSSCGIDENRILLLNSIGFEWNLQDDQWEGRYKELVSYVKEFGDTRVPQNFTQNPSLGKWVANLRINIYKYQNGHTPSNKEKDRIQLLNNIGFEWSIVGRNQQRYEKEFGDTDAPVKFTENMFLRQQVHAQRCDYEEYQNGNTSRRMTENQVCKLSKISFERHARDTLCDREEPVKHVKEAEFSC